MLVCCIPCRMPGVRERFRSERPLIGVIHLPPLPGYPGSPGLAAVVAHALAELAVYRVGGLDGVLVENENDSPHRVTAASETIAAMTRVTHALVAAANRLPVGIEILLNDPEASLAVAHSSGADFIRTDYFADEMQRPEYGVMRIAPADVLAYRARIGAERVLILADIQVKYAQMIAPRTLEESAREAREQGADAILVTGSAHRGAALAAGRAGSARGRRRVPGARRQRPRSRQRPRAACGRRRRHRGHEPDARRARVLRPDRGADVRARVKIVCAADCGVDR